MQKAKLLCTQERWQIEEKVNKYLSEGWRLHGALVIQGTWIYQWVVKNEITAQEIENYKPVYFEED